MNFFKIRNDVTERSREVDWLEKCKSHRFWDEKDYNSLKEKGYSDKDVYVFWCDEDFGQRVYQ